MNNINSIIIEHLKNPVLLSDYAYITESSKGKNKLSIRTRTPQAIINLGLTKLPEKGLYILHHPIFSLFYLGLTEANIIQRWRNHAVKITGIGLGSRAQDTGLYAQLREDFKSLGLDPVEEYKKITIYFIPMDGCSADVIGKQESTLIDQGLRLGLFKYNSDKRHPAFTEQERDFIADLFLQKSKLLDK